MATRRRNDMPNGWTCFLKQDQNVIRIRCSNGNTLRMALMVRRALPNTNYDLILYAEPGHNAYMEYSVGLKEGLMTFLLHCGYGVGEIIEEANRLKLQIVE